MATDTQTIIKENISTVKELRNEVNRLKDALVTAKEGSQEWNDTVKNLTAAQERLTAVNNACKDSLNVVKDTTGIKALKDEISSLKDTLANVEEGTQEWTDACEKLRRAQDKLDKINKAAKGTLDQYNNSEKDSINTLKKRIKELNTERNAMDMNSKEYKKATKELKTLNDKLREAGTSAGDWKANVGNYAQSISGAFSQMGAAATGLAGPVGTLNTSMLKLAANPVGAVIVALTASIGTLAKGIKSSEENTNRWNQVLAPVKATMTLMERGAQNLASEFLDWAESMKMSEKSSNILHKALQFIVTLFINAQDRLKRMKEGFEGFGESISKVGQKIKESNILKPLIEGIDNLYKMLREKLQPVINWIVEKWNWLADTNVGKMLGLQSIQGWKDAWNEAGDVVDNFENELGAATEATRKLDAARAAYAKNERARAKAIASENAVISKLDAEISTLKELEAETEDYGEKNKILAQIKAKTIEQQEHAIKVANMEKASATEYANVLKLQSSLTDNDAAANDALAAAEAKVITATAKADEVTASYGKTLAKIAKQEAANNEKQKAQNLKDAVDALNAAIKNYDAQLTETSAKLSEPVKLEANEMSLEGIRGYYDELQNYYDADLEAYRAMTDGKIAALEEFIEVQKALGNDTAVQEAEIAKLKAAYAKKEEEIYKKKETASKNETKAVKANYNQQFSAYSQLLGGMSELVKDNNAAYKATSVAKAIIDTYLAANNALATLPPPASFITAAASVASGLANVIAILKVKPEGETSTGGLHDNTPNIMPSVEDSTPYSYTRTVQTQQEQDALNQPAIVSVVDIENMMDKRKVRVQETTW